MIRACLCLIAVLFVPFFKGKLTLHFHPSKLQQPFSFKEEWAGAPIAPEILARLNQPFHFLGHGSQTYVFESEDGQTVLKLFRYNRSRFPFIHMLKGWLHQKKKADLFTKLDKTFQAYALAYRHVPARTGLLYIHFNEGDALPEIPIRDALGRTWRLPLSRIRFALQKKAEPFKEAFLTALAQKDDAKVEAMAASLIELLKERAAKGIRNSDPNLEPNFGFINGQAVEIDCGNFRWKPDLVEEEEVRRFAEQMHAWLLGAVKE